jgi:hypothetical protein
MRLLFGGFNMPKYDRIIPSIRLKTPFFEMIQRGLKPGDIKKAVIEILSPYFENKRLVEYHAIDLLAPESIILARLQNNPLFLAGFENCLATYRSAKAANSQSCFESLAWWQPQVILSLSKFWTILYLEIDKRNLEKEEFLHECLRNIGDIIEGLTKPYLKILYHQLKIAQGRVIFPKKIDSLNLGQIVNELVKRSTIASLLVFPPWNIPLNQWRNIAYHHSAEIQNNEIVCRYGTSPNIKEVKFSVNELLQVVQAVSEVFASLKLAHTLFYVDNFENISHFSIPPYNEREESSFLNLAVALASQGFEIIEYSKSQDEARIIVRDVSYLDPANRRFHASQFLYPLWLSTESRTLIVEYRERDNTPNLLVSTFSDICEKIYNSELEIEELAKTMHMIDLKTKRIIKPFSNG